MTKQHVVVAALAALSTLLLLLLSQRLSQPLPFAGVPKINTVDERFGHTALLAQSSESELFSDHVQPSELKKLTHPAPSAEGAASMGAHEAPDKARKSTSSSTAQRSEQSGKPHICLLQYDNRRKFASATLQFIAPKNAKNASQFVKHFDTVQATVCGTFRAVVCSNQHVSWLMVRDPEVSVLRKEMENIESRLVQLDRLATAMVQGNDAPGLATHLPPGQPQIARHGMWYKPAILLLATAMLTECDVVGWLDTDAMLVPSAPALDQQPQITAWLSDPDSHIFVAREPSTNPEQRWPDKDANGRNNMNQTKINAGFMLVKRTRSAQSLLREWWTSPTTTQKRGALGESYELYLWEFAHEQRIFNDLVLAEYNEAISVAKDKNDYNSPHGKYVRHFWFKDRPGVVNRALHGANGPTTWKHSNAQLSIINHNTGGFFEIDHIANFCLRFRY